MTPRSPGDALWDLLPAYLRVADAAAGGVLRALLEVIAAPLEAVERDLDALADEWFIETCAEWAVDYLGDLVGARGLHPLGEGSLSDRARVADTIRHRRRKGTAAMLEELARTTTGWPARAVEYFELLSTTQHLNHVRLGAPATAAVRDADRMALVDTPFDRTAHTVCVRPLGAHRSGHNLPNVGLHVWPVASVPLDRATAAPVTDPPDGRWFVDPLGVDHVMAGPSMTETDIDHRAAEEHTPTPLRRRPLRDELADIRDGTRPEARRRWFRADDPAVVVWLQPTAGDDLEPVPLDLLRICDLSDWDRPTGSLVSVDPVLGRVAVATGRAVHRLAVSWSMASGADLGAGPWSRRGALGPAGDEPDFQLAVSATDPLRAGEVVATLADAVSEWHTWSDDNRGTIGRILLLDSHRHPGGFTGAGAIRIGQGDQLSIVAARWPLPEDGGARTRSAVDPAGVRPVVLGDLEVVGVGDGDRPGAFVIDGVVLAGRLVVRAPAAGDDGLGALRIAHSTLPPAEGGMRVEAGNPRVRVAVIRSLCGAVALAGASGELTVIDSVVHRDGAGAGSAVDADETDAILRGASVLNGTTEVQRLSADDSIFMGPVTVTRRQEGCVRFCWVPPGSLTPKRFRCQPDLALDAAAGDPAAATRVVPSHESLDPADAWYARLSRDAAPELREGAESGAEMGAYRIALSPQRLDNLRRSLEEFLPVGRAAAGLPVESA